MVKNLPVMQETRYSCLENSKDRGVSRATGHVNQELEMTEQLAHAVRARAHTHTHTDLRYTLPTRNIWERG